jgi:iron complex outermembrane receptor protein
MRRPVLALCFLISGTLSFTNFAQITHAAQSPLVLEEIMVTAQKREQSLQDVPLAITALSAENLIDQNIYDILDLEKAVPSLKVIAGYNRANGTPVIIRGMGTLAAQPAFEGSVGTYIDGVYRSRPGMLLSSMLDIGRIEVLRGPQGTLFGKNTTAGALSISSNEPSADPGYAGEVTLGDYDRRRFGAHVTGPLGDSLTGRLAVLSDQRDGFTESVFDHEDYGDLDTQAVRLSLAWDATETLAVKLIADYSESDEVCCFGNSVAYKRDDSLTEGPFTDYYREAAKANFDTDIDLINLDPDDRKTQNNVQPSNETTDMGLVLDVAWEADYGQWRSVTGWRDWQYTSQGDFDFGPVNIGELLEDYDVDSYSQELSLSGAHGEPGQLGSIEYVTGLYYAFEDYEQLRTFDAGPDQAGIWELFWPAQAGAPEPVLRELLGGGEWATDGGTIGDVSHNLETQTMAAFAHVTVALTEQLSMIVGVRYTDEEKTLDRHNLLFDEVADYSTYLQENMLGGYVLGANIAGPDIIDLTYSDSEWTYDLKFQYFLDGDTQLYGGYSRGFKSGGIGMDPEAGGGQPSGQNSKLIQQLLGIGNGTGFADLEDPTYEPEYIDAWELGLKRDFLSGRGRINAALFYNEIEDIQFSVFTGTGFRVENASSAEVAGLELESSFAVTERLNLGFSMTYLDTKYGNDIPEPAPPGRELTHAPQWAGVLNLGYEHPLPAGLIGFLNANWSYRDKTFIAYDNQDRQSAYDLLGLQLGLRGDSGDWDFRVWCSNCLDEDYATAYFNTPFYFDDNLEQYTGQFLAPPRTYGATLRLNF